MKNKLLTVISCLLMAVAAFAQAPQQFNYQAVLRNGTGTPVVSAPVQLRFTIHDGTATGTSVFTETQSTTTNQFGLANVQVGSVGNLDTVSWGADLKFLQVELSTNGGTSFTDMGTTQLISVPYALHAATSGDNLWSSNGLSIHNNNTGWVGIGIANPTAKLHVYNGDLMVEDSPGQSSIWLSQGSIITNDFSGGGSRHIIRVGGNTIWATGKVLPTNSDYYVYNFSHNRPDLSILEATGNVGIGTAAPAAKLDVAGSIKITDGTEGAGKLLVSDANGLASWQTVISNSYSNFTHQRYYISGTLSPWTNISTSGGSVFIISQSYTSTGTIYGFQHDGPDEIVIYNNCYYNWTIVPGVGQASLGPNARAFYTGPTSPNYVIAPGKAVRAFYEPTTDKWWVLDSN